MRSSRLRAEPSSRAARARPRACMRASRRSSSATAAMPAKNPALATARPRDPVPAPSASIAFGMISANDTYSIAPALKARAMARNAGLPRRPDTATSPPSPVARPASRVMRSATATVDIEATVSAGARRPARRLAAPGPRVFSESQGPVPSRRARRATLPDGSRGNPSRHSISAGAQCGPSAWATERRI